MASFGIGANGSPLIESRIIRTKGQSSYGAAESAKQYGNAMETSSFSPMQATALPPMQHPQLEGDIDLFMPQKPRRKSNLLLILLSLVLPWVLFMFVFWCLSFDLAYNSMGAAKFLVVLAFLVVSAIGVFAGSVLYSRFKTNNSADLTWPAFLFVTGLGMCIAAVILGQRNFLRNMQPFYDIQQLNTYSTVNPDLYTGQQMMDAGRINFVEGAHVDVSKSIGFRNKDTYCVAPITSSNSTSENYDFWAIGTNCCLGTTGSEYRCGEYNNPSAHSGLRLMNAEKRAFYRLAVQQATAAYNIQSSHPTFVYYMQDPEAEIQAYSDDGHANFITCLLLALAVQVVLVIAAVLMFSKL